MLVSPTQNSGVGGLSQRQGPTQLFCVAVEYRLNFPRILEVVIFFIDFFHVYFSNSDISTTIQVMSLKCSVVSLLREECLRFSI